MARVELRATLPVLASERTGATLVQHSAAIFSLLGNFRSAS
jgi:hypothetical protein